MAFMSQLEKAVSEHEAAKIFHSGQSFEELYPQCLRLAKKYGIKVPVNFKQSLKQKFTGPPVWKLGGSEPVRISVYYYPWTLAKVEEISEKTGKRKRHIFMEALQLYIYQYEQTWRKGKGKT